MNQKRIWVLGSANLDTTFNVASLPQKGETAFVHSRFTAFGGKGANAAVVCARAGACVSFLGCVGEDSAGIAMRRNLSSCGVDTGQLLSLPGVPSGAAYIIVDSGGSNTILVEPGANRAVPLTLNPAFSSGDLFITQFEGNLDGVLHYLRLARAAGALTLVNPSPFLLREEIFALADYLIVNEVELSMMSGAHIPDRARAAKAAAAEAKRYGCRMLVTLGADGALMADGGAVQYADPYPVDAVDTQGAGDTFLGIFAASLAGGLPPTSALLRTNLAASHSVTRRGSAQECVPDLSLVDEKLRLLFPGDTFLT